MTSKIIVNTIEADTGISSVTFASNINLQNDSSVLVSSSGVRLGTGSTIAAPSANEITLSTNSAERLRLTSAGKVGIGTAVPSQLFTVYSPINGVTASIEANTTRAYDSATLKFLGGNLSTNTLQFGDATVADVGKIVYNHDGNSLAFTVNSSERLRITSAGSVGIGTDTPGTTKLKIETGSGTRAISLNAPTNGTYITFETAGTAYADIGAEKGVVGSGSADTPVINARGSRDISFRTNSSERLRITSDGKIGVNDTSPASLFTVNNGTNDDHCFLIKNDNVGAYFGTYGTGHGSYPREVTINGTRIDSGSAPYLRIGGQGGIKFCVDLNTERLRIDSSGRALIGSPNGSTSQFLQIKGDTGASNNGGTILLQNGVADSSAGNGTGLGGIAFGGATGNQYCRIEGFADGSGGTNDYPGRIVFSTTADAASSPTERMRIDSNGRVTMPNQPCAMAYNAQGQHMAGNAVAQFNSTYFNIGNMYNSSNGRMTVPIAGRYLVAYSGLHDYVSQNAIGFDFLINGSNFDGGEGYQECTTSSNSQLAKTLILNLSANDYVQIFIRQSGTQVHQRYGSFSMCLIT